jgi:hypothetical protein
MNRSKYELLEPYTRETPKFPLHIWMKQVSLKCTYPKEQTLQDKTTTTSILKRTYGKLT